MYTGHNELWELVEAAAVTATKVGAAPLAIEGKIAALSKIAQSYYAKIQKLETASPFSFLGTPLSKKEDRMAECAKMYLKLGNFKAYCELMISLSTIFFCGFICSTGTQENTHNRCMGKGDRICATCFNGILEKLGTALCQNS